MHTGRRESVLTATHWPGLFSPHRAMRTALRARVGVFSMILIGIGSTLATQGEYTPTTTTRFKFPYSLRSYHQRIAGHSFSSLLNEPIPYSAIIRVLDGISCIVNLQWHLGGIFGLIGLWTLFACSVSHWHRIVSHIRSHRRRWCNWSYIYETNVQYESGRHRKSNNE
jgi:hypothetical protein